MPDPSPRDQPERSARAERLAQRLTELNGSLDRAQQELDGIAAGVRSARADVQRARRSSTWRLARATEALASAASLGRADLGAHELEAATVALESLGRRLSDPVHANGGSRRRLRVTVVSWDMTHNGVIRAHYLADLLSRRHLVEHIGPSFFGPEVWKPIRGSKVPTHTFPGRELPRFASDAAAFLTGLGTDVVYVCKARFPSLLLGMLLKHIHGVPVIIDVDERELGFVGAAEGISLDRLRELRGSSDFRVPYGKLWTQACQELVSDADSVVVASEVLQPLHGGPVVPHVRDELAFDPGRFDRDEVRAQLGYGPEDRVVLFAGTANRHKGLLEVAGALKELGDPRLKLCVAGSLSDPTMRNELARLAADRVQLIDFVPVSEIPRLTVAGDLMCLLQDPGSSIARYQTPAKLTEALAMGVPVLAHETPPLAPFADQGLIHTVGEQPLARRIAELVSDRAVAASALERGRPFFLEHLSYASGGETLDEVIREARERRSEVPDSWSRAFEIATSSTTAPRTSAVRRRVTGAPPRVDIAFFWRLSYSGVYGRRPDMLIKHLAASERTRRLVLFDRPTDWPWLESRRREARTGVNHFDLIYRRGRRLAWGGRHQGKLSSYMFVAQPPKRPVRWQELLLPTAGEYLGYVDLALRRDRMGRDCPLVFWVWPPVEHFTELHEAFSPALTVTDVVDDERTWSEPGSVAHERLTRDHEAIFAASDLVITHNVPLAERLRMFGVQARLLTNAAELFEDAPGRRPRELRGLKGPIIGYSGNLSWRFDIELVDRMAREHPEWQLVIIGSAHGSEDVLVLSRHPNVHFLGVKTYPDVVRYIRSFDVGILPHLDDPMSRSMNPLKAYLYASCGVPAVSTEVANLVRLDGAIRVAGSHDAFIAAVAETIERRARGDLALDPASLLRDDTWTGRVQAVEGWIDEALSERLAAQG